MAYFTTAPQGLAGDKPGVFARLRAAFADMAGTIERVQHYNALTGLSDTELARRGLTRENLARHVFIDTTWN